MITQEFLSQCSEEQINRGVEWMLCKSLSLRDKSQFDDYQFGYFNTLNYCTRPSDIMPIAFANAISLETFDGSKWWADALLMSDDKLPETITSREVKNPLRAICEVYILMGVNK